MDEPDELLYHDGNWFLFKPPVFETPKFEFDWDAEIRRNQILRDWQWSMTIAPPLISPVIVTGC